MVLASEAKPLEIGPFKITSYLMDHSAFEHHHF